MKPLFGLFFVSGLLLTAGCAPGGVSTAIPVDAVTTSVAQLTKASAVVPSSEPGSEVGGPQPGKTANPDPNVQKLVLLAVEDLSKELQTGTEGIQVSSIQAVVWPDPSLECPKLGILYAQVVTPGYIIVLELKGKDFPFHTDGSSTVIYCPEDKTPLQENPSQIPPPISSATPPQLHNTPQNDNLASTPPGGDEFVNLAKQDLANRLNIGVDQISLFKITEITWPDISKGCSPASGQILSKGQVSGYRIWLEAGGEKYIYQVGLNSQVIACPTLNPGANNPLLMTPGSPTPIPGNQSP